MVMARRPTNQRHTRESGWRGRKVGSGKGASRAVPTSCVEWWARGVCTRIRALRPFSPHTQAHILILAAHRARALPENLSPFENRGRGEFRVPNAPAAWCALGVVKYAHQYSQRRHRKHPAFPTQWFYGLYVISPATNSFCHRRHAD